MIRINLLPAETEAAPTQINPLIPLVPSAIVPVIIIVFIHLGQAASRKHLEAEAVSLRSQLDTYQPIIAQVEALESAKVQLTQRKGVIQQLESERLRYPEFMDDFVKLLPGNLWLTTLNTTSSNPNSMTIGMDVVALDNYAVADLISNLETSQIFSDVDLGAITATQSAVGGESMSFHLSATYKKASALPDATKKS